MDVTNQILTIVKELQETVGDLKESMVKLEKKVDEGDKRNYEAIQATNKEVKANQADIKNLYTEVKANQADIKSLHTAVKENQADIKNLYTEVKANHAEMKKINTEVKANQADIKNLYTEIKVNQAEIEATYKETRAVNQRLAVFQEEMSRKVQTLFDADLTRQQHLEAYDEKIQKIESELFDNSIRLGILESKVLGA